MDRTEHQMPRERRFNGDIRRFFVTHFTDHDHIWIRPQEGSHGGGEGQPDLGMDLNLS